MNLQSLQAIIAVLKETPKENFDMSNIWKCVIGTAYKSLGDKSGSPIEWFDSFVGCDDYFARQYIISGRWYYVDNSIEGAVKRIEEVIAYYDSPAPIPGYFKTRYKEMFDNLLSLFDTRYEEMFN